MNIGVYGLWHLGAVTATCLASLNHDVIGIDPNQKLLNDLREGVPPIYEPDLEELLKVGLQSGRLTFSLPEASVFESLDVLWVTFDTPVDEDDVADVEYVYDQITFAIQSLREGALVVISSQMPVGTIGRLESYCAEVLHQKEIQIASSPENLRLGNAIKIFLNPDRIIVGVRDAKDKEKFAPLFQSITDNIVWMSTESAEMTKHAINSFLALSVTYANEISKICEKVGAHAKDVERGLKSEMRIGPKAYLSPGGAFAGGTLARDVEFLNALASKDQLTIPLLQSIKRSNDLHKKWVQNKLFEKIDDLKSSRIGIWGLTYKAGTDTLRRSLAVELGDWLLCQGAGINAHDPRVKELPGGWVSQDAIFCSDPLAALVNVDALVIGAEWPEYQQLTSVLRGGEYKNLIIIDANRHLGGEEKFLGMQYFAVGTPG